MINEGRVYFEFRPIGRQVKISAIDEATGIEISTIAPSSASRSDMKQAALAKLHYALERLNRM